MRRRWILTIVCFFSVVTYAFSSSSSISPPTTKAPTCKPMENTKDEKTEWPEVGFYTKGLSIMMQNMIGGINEETAKEMGEIVTNPEETHTHIMNILLHHGWIMTIFIILILIAIGLLIAIVIVLICRWVRPAKEGIDPSVAMMIVTLISIVVCGVICTAGAFVFFLSIQEVKTGIDNIGGQLEKTSAHISQFVGNYESFMNCTMMTQGAELRIVLAEKKKELAKVTDKFMGELDETIKKGDLLSVSDTKQHREIQTIKKDLTTFKTQVEGVKKSLQGIVDEAGKAIQENFKQLLEVVKKVKKGFKKMEDQMMAVIRDNNYYSGAMSSVLQWSFLIPLGLVATLGFAFVVLFIRFVGNCTRKEKGQKRNLLSTIFSYVLAVAGYASMVIGMAFFAVAAGCFLVAFASMFLCMGFFDDPDLLVFSAFPSLTVDVNGFTLHDAFVRCKNEYPFFDAIDGDKQLAADTLEGVLTKIMNQDFGESFRTYSISEKVLDEIRKEAGNPKINDYYQALYKISSRAHRDDLTLEIDDKLEELINDLQQRVADQMKTVLDMSPQCESMMKIWDKAGGFICNGLSMPSQGTWMACVICGIGSFTVFHWMFKSTLYLKNFEDENKSKVASGERSNETAETPKKKKKKKGKKSKSKTPKKSEE